MVKDRTGQSKSLQRSSSIFEKCSLFNNFVLQPWIKSSKPACCRVTRLKLDGFLEVFGTTLRKLNKVLNGHSDVFVLGFDCCWSTLLCTNQRVYFVNSPRAPLVRTWSGNPGHLKALSSLSWLLWTSLLLIFWNCPKHVNQQDKTGTYL